MKQSRLMSWLESLINIAVGFSISLLAQMYFLPLLGVQIEFRQNLFFALIMTVISIVRSFTLRRLFEAFHIRRPLSPFMTAAIEERFRQIKQEGWSTEHDDQHAQGELALAAAAYASAPGSDEPPEMWPWEDEWWKTGDGLRRSWVKACALIFAEGEKFDRSRKKRRAF